MQGKVSTGLSALGFMDEIELDWIGSGRVSDFFFSPSNFPLPVI